MLLHALCAALVSAPTQMISNSLMKVQPKFSDEGPATPITGEADEDAVGVCPVGAISVEE